MSDTSFSRWTPIRETCVAFREISIVVGILLLLFTPSTVKRILERAGIRSVAGIEFDVEELSQVEEETLQAKTLLVELEQKLEALAAEIELTPTEIEAITGVSGIESIQRQKVSNLMDELLRGAVMATEKVENVREHAHEMKESCAVLPDVGDSIASR